MKEHTDLLTKPTHNKNFRHNTDSLITYHSFHCLGRSHVIGAHFASPLILSNISFNNKTQNSQIPKYIPKSSTH